MARLDLELSHRPKNNGQSLEGHSRCLTELVRLPALIETITHRRGVEKPAVIESACEVANAIILELRFPYRLKRQINLIAPSDTELCLSVGGESILFNGSETVIPGLSRLGRVTSARLVYDGDSFKMRFFNGETWQSDCLVEVGLGVSPVLVTLTGALDFFTGSGMNAELRRSYIDLPSLRN